MASILKLRNSKGKLDGRLAIQFDTPPGSLIQTGPKKGQPRTAKRVTLTLDNGNCDLKTARHVKGKIESLLCAIHAGGPIDEETARWVGSRPPDFHAKLVAVGLVAPRAGAVTVAPGSELLEVFLSTYIGGLQNKKERTVNRLQQDAASLVEFAGAGRKLSEFTPGDADDFVEWLRSPAREIGEDKKGYAEATIGRRIRSCKEFFRYAVRKHKINGNPFDDVKAPSQENDERFYFVDRETIAKVLAACPCAEWRLIVALARYGGLRTPSEPLALRWGDVDWERGRLRVPSPKTAHHKGKAFRWIPIFPELRPYLDEVFALAEEGAVKVITRYQNQYQNLGTQFTRIIWKAGLIPWPRLFHNLRASRQNELMKQHPIHVVCDWIGNNALIAKKHYLHVDDADFAAALLPANDAQNDAAPAGIVGTERMERNKLATPKHESTQVLVPSLSGQMSIYPRQDSNLRPPV